VITESLTHLVTDAIRRARADGLVEDPLPSPSFERPRNRAHGDWSTNIALVARRASGGPRDAAQAIKERLDPSDLVEKVDVAGPGFLNFYLAPAWLHHVVRRAADANGGFGRALRASGTRFNVEFVSANPTGPINVVSGRHAAVGDAIANLLDAAGHEVTREFYANDAGRQARLFALSIAARYLEHHGRPAELPEDGYRGDYVASLAADIAAEVGDRYVDAPDDERADAMRVMGLQRMLASMRASLERFGVRYDEWFAESDLHEAGAVDEALSLLRDRGETYEKDGALWFRSSDRGDDKDRVLVRTDGQPTYLAGDAAYLRNKFGRGFDRLIYLWGADHHGTVTRLLAVAEALGFDRKAIEIRLVQIVSLMSGGETVKASKRAGVYVPLDELIDEVGTDAARYTFLARSIDAPLDFDIELAKQQAPENPVYYVQYAHARISSILRKAEAEGHVPDVAAASLDRLQHPSEDELMRKLATFEDVVPEAAEMRAPQKITRYVEELASTFSSFYRDCRVVSDDRELTQARLALCLATRAVIQRGLALLGVSAPERM